MTAEAEREEYDVVIVGAGWAGMYMLYQARSLGLRAVVLEAGGGVGGTWYWNRYPGARCDTPSLEYSYSFSEELEQEWSWSEIYAAQPEIERYANYVADKFDLRPDIRFETRMSEATYDEQRSRWLIDTDRGEHLEAQYCVMATGGYSEPYLPDIPGINSFNGEMYLSQQWPQHEVDYTGKRVGVVGTGASGMQIVTAIADEPLEQLTVFQRTANNIIPARNDKMDPEYEREYKARYREYRAEARLAPTGSLYEKPHRVVSEMDDAEFTEHMDRVYARGGASIYGSLRDLLLSEESNARVTAYLNDRVRTRVDDPATAALLTDTQHYLGARRVLIENGYPEKFNKDNVSLVGVKQDPITEILPNGLRTKSGREFELDMLIFATGFDSGTGAMRRLNINGKNGQTLNDRWENGAQTYLGLLVNGFPNMFFLGGPGSPSIRSQVLVSIEQHVEWVTELLKRFVGEQVAELEATQLAEQQWTDHLNEMVAASLLVRDDTQYWGTNVPGKPRAYVAYIGGSVLYRAICDAVAAADYEGIARRGPGGEELPMDPGWSGVTPELLATKSRAHSVV